MAARRERTTGVSGGTASTGLGCHPHELIALVGLYIDEEERRSLLPLLVIDLAPEAHLEQGHRHEQHHSDPERDDDTLGL